MTMSQLKYTELLKNYKNPDEIRKRIKERYWESYEQKKDAYRAKHGLENFKETKKIKKKISYGLYSEIAREFGCQPNTVKKFAHRKNPRALDKTPKNIVVVNPVPLCEVAIQTNNGSEFIQSIFAKFESHFQYLIEKVANAEYRRIPVGKKEYNSSVENFNKYVEYEFLALEDFDNNLDLTVKKFYSYQVDYNTERIYDYGLKKQTPLSYLKGHDQRINTAIAYFPVCILDQDFRDLDKRLTPEYYQKLKLLKTNKVLYNNFKHQTLRDVGGLFNCNNVSSMKVDWMENSRELFFTNL